MFGGFFLVGVLFAVFSREGDDDGESSLLGKSSGNPKVGVVDLEGEIMSSHDFAKYLQKAVRNDSLKAIVVRIDSPGGAVGASEEIYRLIKEADQKKPVVCSLGNVAASGGLFASVGCRKVLLNKGTITGSIGVIMMSPNVSAITDKFGFKMNVIKSGAYKDASSPFKPISKDDTELLQSIVSKAHEQFIQVVAAGRGLDVEKVRSFADGRIILGEQSVELGLADGIGGLNDAAQLALKLSGVEGEANMVPIRKPKGFKSWFEEVDSKALLPWRAWTESRLLYRADF